MKHDASKIVTFDNYGMTSVTFKYNNIEQRKSEFKEIASNLIMEFNFFSLN